MASELDRVLVHGKGTGRDKAAVPQRKGVAGQQWLGDVIYMASD